MRDTPPAPARARRPAERVPLARYGRLLVAYAAPHRAKLLLLGATLAATVGLQLAGPLILRAFIDAAIAGAGADRLVPAALLFIAAALAQQAVSVAEAYVSEDVGWRATNALRADLALHCLRLDMGFHKEHPPGELLERIDGDVNALAGFFSRFVVTILGNVVLLAGMLVVLFGVDWRVGLTFTAFSAAVLALLTWLRHFGASVWAVQNRAIADFVAFVEERLVGLEDIAANGAGPYVLYRDDLMRRGIYRSAFVPNLLSGGTAATTFVVFSLATAVAFVLGAERYAAGAMTLGTVYLIASYAELLRRPLEQVSQQLQDLQRAGGAVIRIGGLLAARPEVHDGPGPPPATPAGSGPPRVAFDRVTFAYPEPGAGGVDRPPAPGARPASPALAEVSFSLAPGQVLGVVGRTGSGKSTLARLLFRLYDPQAGTIALGGVDLRRFRLEDLRRRVGLVTQDVQLFRATVRDNLTFFDPAVPDARLVEVLGEVGLGEWLAALPDGLDTEIAAQPPSLSAGQAQLLAFGRVLLRDPELVVLDEASARLDPATERLVERAVDRLLGRGGGTPGSGAPGGGAPGGGAPGKARTAVVIAHRLATIERADHVLVLERGRVVELGPRAELAADPASRFAGLLASEASFSGRERPAEVATT